MAQGNAERFSDRVERPVLEVEKAGGDRQMTKPKSPIGLFGGSTFRHSFQFGEVPAPFSLGS